VATPAVIVAAFELAAAIRGVEAEGFAGDGPVVGGTESPAELEPVPEPEPDPELGPVGGGVVVTGGVVTGVVVTGTVVVAGGEVLTGVVDVVPVPVVPFVVSMPGPLGALVAPLAVASVKS
jgi:hypothetical protein